MRRAFVILWLAFLPGALAAWSAPASGVWTHDIDVTLQPPKHALEATDRILVGRSDAPLRFSLHAGLTISSCLIDGKESRGALRKSAGARESLAVYEGPAVAPGARLQIVYAGTINDPVSAEKGVGFVAGDSTTGLIAPEGVFLDGGTGWVPIVETPGGTMALYNVAASVPDPWRVVTQGRRLAAKPGARKNGFAVERYAAEVPSDGLALVAGNYAVKSVEHAGVVISTYFFPEEAPQADLFLARTAEYLDRFAALLTPYPYSRFDIVENFFTTGYGFPSFTLLGRDVVKMGEMALRPGYVDHEVMHCWWGNYVYTDTKTGNWCEGLTTYFANYLAQEAAGPKEAADYRRNIAQKYSLRVRPDIDYPLARFTEKKRDFENEIGYGKAAMVFHQLRRMAGDEVFFRTMRGMVAAFGGRRAGWADFRAAFEQATGRDLGGFFSEWIDRPGLPSLGLGEARAAPSGEAGGRYRITGTIVQDGDAIYHVSVPLAVETAAGRREFTVEAGDRSTSFSVASDAMPLEVRLDPDMHLLRRLSAPEIPPCLNAVLEDGVKYVVPPAAAAAPEDAYAKVADAAAEGKGAVKRREDEMAGGLPAGASVLLLGRPDQNGVTKIVMAGLEPPVKVTTTGFTVAGETFNGPEYSVVYSARRPDDPNHVVALFFGMTPESLARSRNLFYYGWDSWVVFKSGRPERRGTFEIVGSRARRTLVSDATAAPGGGRGITGASLLDHVRGLAGPSMAPLGGRRPGAAGHDAAADYIEKFLAANGVAPPGAVAPFVEGYRHPFTLPLVDVDEAGAPAAIHVRRGDEEAAFPATALPFPPPAAPAGDPDAETIFLDPEDLASMAAAARPPRLDIGTVITVARALPPADAGPADPRGRSEFDPRAASLLADEARGAARLGASTLILVRAPDAPAALETLASFPSRPTAADAEAIAGKRKAGEFPGPDVWFAGRQSRLPLPGPMPDLLVVAAGPDLGADLLGRRAFLRHAAAPLLAVDPAFRPIQLDLAVTATAPLRVTRQPMVNIVGYIEGADPALRKEAVMVTAHYDAFGRAEEGAALPGASDNAAGVAALLETARWLAASHPARSIIVAATDGEEWGLAGSRALAGRLPEIPLKPVAVVNIDSIGARDVASPWLIGGSYYPDIRTAVSTLAPIVGLTLGRDIDPYAFAYGSDYYPFHLAGVPAVGFFAASYRALHGPGDTLETIDPAAMEKVARLAALTIWALAN